jgi:hypothetical protein
VFGCGNRIYNLGSIVANFRQVRGRGGSGGGESRGRLEVIPISFIFLFFPLFLLEVVSGSWKFKI